MQKKILREFQLFIPEKVKSLIFLNNLSKNNPYPNGVVFMKTLPEKRAQKL
ncbi:hypothetical protein HMPREF0497_0633 [Lentilactobacillus buchneri ATCC 11577]|nr:hypothetical protein HMPREF0497_0633 [Lentilactobacillus buchneri ATCC 11577]